ncbi:sulfotransferase [Thalassobacillus sp. CUG 92003]|uniref:sulfotransferase family protein n=1 Tax=Thalassobacillus sp. CUG 92003 TaxID=2736641 RepID=UPI0015E72ED8|nr:sulfotransferase [Thalassobacillus sp. CUG 92003]
MTRKPDFFIVGAAKAGTTSLYEYLTQHPDIYMPDHKEPHYFGEYKASGAYIDNLKDYHSLFKGASMKTKVGEASTSYLYSTKAAKEIKKYQPNAKIIIMLRNPVDRAYSLYWHQVRDSFESLSFEEALENESQRIDEGRMFGFHYVQSGFYYQQVKRYMDIFGGSNVKVCIFEEFKKDPLIICNDIFQFLGIERLNFIKADIYNKSGQPKFTSINKVVNKNSIAKKVLKGVLPKKFRKKLWYTFKKSNLKPAPPMKVETRDFLYKKFNEDIDSLEILIEKNLDQWRI